MSVFYLVIFLEKSSDLCHTRVNHTFCQYSAVIITVIVNVAFQPYYVSISAFCLFMNYYFIVSVADVLMPNFIVNYYLFEKIQYI